MDARVGRVHLSRRAEHAPGRAGPRARRHADDPAPPVREGSGSRAGPAARRALLRDSSHRLPHREIRPGRPWAAGGHRVPGPLGEPLSRHLITWGASPGLIGPLVYRLPWTSGSRGGPSGEPNHTALAPAPGAGPV